MNRFRKRFITAVVAGALLGGGAYAAHRTYVTDDVLRPSVLAEENAEASGGTVWICGGPKSIRYHSSSGCCGLKRCSRTPQKISLAEAKKRNYTPCHKCY